MRSRTIPARALIPSAVPLVLALLAGLTGCSSLDQRLPPKYDIRGQDVYIVPFSKGNDWHGDSSVGNMLTRALELTLSSECDGLMAIQDREVLREIRLDLSDEVDWLEYGRRAGAHFLIVGTIDDMELTSARRLGMWSGKMLVRYQVWDIVEGRRGFVSGVQVNYPTNPESGDIVIGFEENRDEIEKKLLSLAAQDISKALCGYVPDGPQ